MAKPTLIIKGQPFGDVIHGQGRLEDNEASESARVRGEKDDVAWWVSLTPVERGQIIKAIRPDIKRNVSEQISLF